MIEPRAAVAGTELAVHGGYHARPGDAAAVRYDFSTCLNAFGPAAIVRRAVQTASIDEYPDPECRAPREAAATLWNRPVEEIAFGAGAAELIHAVCLAYLEARDDALIVAPAFGEYERAILLRGARPRFIWCRGETIAADEWAAIHAKIGIARPQLVFLCAPTTPTGVAISHHDIRPLADRCESAGSLLVLDQAYDAFAEHPVGTPALAGHPAVLHIRSLTKEHAIAGVRVAFAIGPVPVVDALRRVRVPWSASSVAQAAAVAAMTEEAGEHVRRTVATLRAEATRLRVSCGWLGFPSLRSTTHYFILRMRDASSARRTLLDRTGICVRDCTSFGLPEYVRVAARTVPENDALLLALGLAELDPYRTISDAAIVAEAPING